MKKYLYPIATLFILALTVLQVYFYMQIKKISEIKKSNENISTYISVLDKFIGEEFLDQVKDFNSKYGPKQ